MIETKIQSKKMKVNIVFISNSDCFLLHSCFYTVLEYLQRLYIFIFKFLAFVIIFNTVYFKCSI